MYFIDEKGNQHLTAKIDGYDIAERTLEGVMITFSFDTTLGKWAAAFDPKDDSYLSDYNTAKFLQEALDYFDDMLSESETCALVLPKNLMCTDIVDATGQSLLIPVTKASTGFTVSTIRLA